VSGKIAYAAVLYVCYGMLVTAVEIPYYALLPTMTRKPGERTLVVQLSMFVASITILVTTSFTTNLVAFFGKGNDVRGYMTIVLFAGIVMILTSLAVFLTCKEKYFEEEKKIKPQRGYQGTFETQRTAPSHDYMGHGMPGVQHHDGLIGLLLPILSCPARFDLHLYANHFHRRDGWDYGTGGSFPENFQGKC
jgi:hypothetical protein